MITVRKTPIFFFLPPPLDGVFLIKKKVENVPNLILWGALKCRKKSTCKYSCGGQVAERSRCCTSNLGCR